MAGPETPLFAEMWARERQTVADQVAAGIASHVEGEDHRRPRGLDVLGCVIGSPAAAGGGAFVGAKAHDNNGTIFTSGASFQVISFNVEDFDTASMFDLGTPNLFTIPSDGTYHLVASTAVIQYFSTPAGDFAFELIVKAGGARVAGQMLDVHAAQIGNGTWACLLVDDYVQLTAGDTVQLGAEHNAGVSLVADTTQENWTRLTVVKVG